VLYLSSEVIPGYTEQLLDRTSEELREIAESELEDAELGNSNYDLKYRRNDTEGQGAEYSLEEAAQWYEGTEFEDIEVDRNIGVEEIEVNVMNGETRVVTPEGERFYNFCGAYGGEAAMLADIGGQEYALLYDEQANSLEGLLLETGENVEMSSKTGEKTSLMREVEFIRDFYTEVYSQIFQERDNKDYEIEITDQMQDDLEDLPPECRDSVEKKTEAKENKMDKLGLDPEQAFNKPLNNDFNGILQDPLGSDFRAWFIEGTHLDQLDDNKIYGLRAMTKTEIERESSEVKQDSNISSGADYAARFI
jgi:hypothetical protein